MIEQTLHGLVVGLGKIRKDGSKEFRWLDKPIHNRIVQSGLDNYFMYNGSPTDTPSNVGNLDWLDNRFLASYYEYDMSRQGMLCYIAIGTDGTPTSFTDTALKSQVGGYSYDDSGFRQLGYFGNRLNSDNSISFRVPRVSVAVDSATTVREIGWFDKYISGNTYVMFSRVVLPNPIDLDAGEKLSVIYQMNVSYGNLEESEVPQSLLTGMLDSDGNQLRARSSYRLFFTTNNNTTSPPTIGDWFNGYSSSGYYKTTYRGTFFGVQANESYGTINSKVYGSNLHPQYGYYIMSPFTLYNTDKQYALTYTLNSNFTMPEQLSVVNMKSSSATALTESNANITSWNPKPYELGSYQRDREIIVSPTWPSMTGEGYQDIYAICHNSYLIRFGYYDNTDPSNPVWVPKPWRKRFGQSYKFTFRYKLSTADTVE